MLTLTFIADGTAFTPGTDPAGLVLCNTTRSITELGVEFNHQRVISVEQLATALGSGNAALAQDLANQRNTLALRVRRSVDLTNPTPAAFADPEAALAFALQQPAQFAGTGTLKIRLQGVTTNVTLYLLNCGVQSIKNRFEDLGIAPVFDYTFNGALITTVSPFA